MKKVVLYPTLEEALELHRVVLNRFGGRDGVRDLGLLQSALGRPQTGYYATLSLQAAALLESLARNYSFTDGNKRMAFALAAIFLRLNGYRLRVDAHEGERFLIEDVIQKKVPIEKIVDWLEHHMKAVRK